MQKKQIICAIDSVDLDYASHLTRSLKDKIAAVKLGLEFFTACGLDGVKKIEEIGLPIFLDLKLHDIPNTVARTLAILKNLNLMMLTVHISGGTEMMKAAVEELADTKIKIIGVTILTSLSDNDLHIMGLNNKTISEHALHFAHIAKAQQLNGIVCSGHEIEDIRKICGQDFTIVVPGIRLSLNHNDQKRIISPSQAIKLGADYLVIGREITMNSDPIKTIECIKYKN